MSSRIYTLLESLNLKDRIIENKKVQEVNAAWNEEEQEQEEIQLNGMKVHICQSCGGEIIGDENSVATE